MIRTLVLLLLLLPLSTLAQKQMDKSRGDLKKELEKYVTENSRLEPKLIETDTTLTLTVKDPGTGEFSFVYSFDPSGNCNTERVIASCDSCRIQKLNTILEQKNYQWKKINENQYVSKFSDKLLIELPPENMGYYFTIYKSQWTKEIYDILTKN